MDNAIQLQALDYWVLAAYGLILLGLIIYVGVRKRSGDGFFLAGRSLTWGVIGFSLFASNMSSTTLLGLTGAAYEWGIAVSNYEWLAGVPLLFAVFFVVPIYLRSNIRTVPEYLELRYDVRSRQLFSLLTILTTILVDTAGGLYAGGVVLQLFFPGLDLWVIVPLMALLAGSYAAVGGLKVVAYTDVLQAIALITGCAFMAYFVFENVEGLRAAGPLTLEENKLRVMRPLDDAHLPWLGTLFGLPLLGFWYWTTNQYVVQRVLAARDLANARKGMIFAGFLKIVPLFILVLPATYAVFLLPDDLATDQVFPAMIATLLPAGLLGLILAALFSAILSSVDSTLNSTSTLVVIDFVEAAHERRLLPAQEARYGKICTVIFMVIAALWAPMIQYFGGLWAYLQQFFAVIVPPVAVIFLGGLFWRRGTALAAFYTLVIGLSIGAAVMIAQVSNLLSLHFTLTAPLVSLGCAALYYALSLKSNPPVPALLNEMTYHKEKQAAGSEELMIGDYRLWAGLLGAALVFVLVSFF